MSTFSLWLLCIIGIFVASWGFGWGYGYWRYKRAVELHACTDCPPSDDAIESAKTISSFLSKRAWVCHLTACTDKNILGFSNEDARNYLSNYYSWVAPIRIAHALGCEILVRQVTDEPEDIERKVDTEVRSKMRKEWYAAYKKRDAYMGVGSWYDLREGNPIKSIEDFYEEGGALDTLRKAGKI